MNNAATSMDFFGVAWRLGATLFFVALNGFFVAAEFGLVKVRATRIDSLAEGGRRSAAAVQEMLGHLDLYLSACQLGITMASLALGALGEPAVSVLIVAAARAVDVPIDPDTTWLPFVSIATAFLVITILHVTLGEQAPKMWALRKAEPTVLWTAPLLRAFTWVFGPFIVAINATSNFVLGLFGLSQDAAHDATHSAEEIRSILSLSAEAGHISNRQHEITENVFQMMDLEVRHIIVPRVEVEFLSLRTELAASLTRLKESTHSRFPLCEDGLDTIIGFVHAKDILRTHLNGEPINLASLAREPMIVPDTMPLTDCLRQLQNANQHCAGVIDEHGTVIGLVFLEDALEEIVGPLGDEFDENEVDFVEIEDGLYEMSGRLSLPDALHRIQVELGQDDENEDTIGGYVTALLGRLPRKGDTVRIGSYDVSVIETLRRRPHKLRMQRRTEPTDDPA